LPEARGILEKLLDIEPNALPYEIHRTAEDSSQDLVNELPLDWTSPLPRSSFFLEIWKNKLASSRTHCVK